jgi:hypothetical protein
MLCRQLRIWPWRGIVPALVACLALIGANALTPATWPEEETASFTPTTHHLPLTGLAESSGVRVEKQAQSHRPFIKKPDRSARLFSPGRGLSLRPWNPTQRVFRALPRRSLYAARSRPGSPDDPSDPLLS